MLHLKINHLILWK